MCRSEAKHAGKTACSAPPPKPPPRSPIPATSLFPADRNTLQEADGPHNSLLFCEPIRSRLRLSASRLRGNLSRRAALQSAAAVSEAVGGAGQCHLQLFPDKLNHGFPKHESNPHNISRQPEKRRRRTARNGMSAAVARPWLRPPPQMQERLQSRIWNYSSIATHRRDSYRLGDNLPFITGYVR